MTQLKSNVTKVLFQTEEYFYTYLGLNLLQLASKYDLDLKKNRGLQEKGFDPFLYEVLKDSPNTFLCVLDVSSNKILFQTHNSKQNIEAASLSKVWASMSALDTNKGTLPSVSDYEDMLRLLVCSNNQTWDNIQDLGGGTEGVDKWAQEKGFNVEPDCKTNLVNAYDMCRFWSAVLRGQFLGSELILKLSSACKTHDTRALKYMPADCFLGGKTGTFEQANHDSCWILYNGRFYVITVMTLLGSTNETLSDMTDEEVALLFRGLFDEFVQ